jgi:WhiB family redox-sensing transcriptional regulator
MDKISGWQLKANCSPNDFDLFFSNSKTKRKQALSLCNTCPVIDECLDYAIENNVEHGIYGGRTSEQRKARNVRHR